MSYLVDTSWVIEYVRGNTIVIDMVSELRDEGIAISAISMAELYRGVFISSRPDANEAFIDQFLERTVVLDFNQEISRIFGRESARLRRIGQTVGAMDLLIASTALCYDLTLLSSDRDFERITGLSLILI